MTTHAATETADANKTADGHLRGSDSGWVSLLDSARSNGHKRYVRGLSTFAARLTPLDPTPGRRRPLGPGYIVEIETAGREIDYDEVGELLAFAEAYFDGKC
jgi:hypothetical protein